MPCIISALKSLAALTLRFATKTCLIPGLIPDPIPEVGTPHGRPGLIPGLMPPGKILVSRRTPMGRPYRD